MLVIERPLGDQKSSMADRAIEMLKKRLYIAFYKWIFASLDISGIIHSLSVSFHYIKKFSVKNWSRWNGTDYPLIQRTKLLKNVTQIIPMLPWVKLDKNDCINCVLSLINWDDTSGFMVSLFENWIDLYVGTSHFYIEATVIAI